MNQSGVAVAHILGLYERPFLVVVDDVNLPLGRVRLRSKGRDGGHLGLRSITGNLGTENFPRLRIGVGRAGEDVAAYVLDSFTRQEKRLLNKIIDEGIRGVKMFIKEDFARAQNYINSINIHDID
jgi:PTH1 family peptidyl-tRNA hydrolase